MFVSYGSVVRGRVPAKWGRDGSAAMVPVGARTPIDSRVGLTKYESSFPYCSSSDVTTLCAAKCHQQGST